MRAAFATPTHRTANGGLSPFISDGPVVSEARQAVEESGRTGCSWLDHWCRWGLSNILPYQLKIRYKVTYTI